MGRQQDSKRCKSCRLPMLAHGCGAGMMPIRGPIYECPQLAMTLSTSGQANDRPKITTHLFLHRVRVRHPCRQKNWAQRNPRQSWECMCVEARVSSFGLAGPFPSHRKLPISIIGVGSVCGSVSRFNVNLASGHQPSAHS